MTDPTCPAARPGARPPARPVIQMPRITPEQRELIAERLRTFTDWVRRAMQEFAAAWRRAVEQMREVVDTLRATARAVRAADRPAWASPYGPAPRRNTHDHARPRIPHQR